MLLGLMRHGEASFDAPSDSERPLTTLGAAQSASVWAKLGMVEAYLVTSDYRRAIETASLSDGMPIQESLSQFRPDASPERALKLLESKHEEAIVLVAHQPFLGSLASLLINGHAYEPHPFCTSECLLLDMPWLGPGQANVVRQILPQ